MAELDTNWRAKAVGLIDLRDADAFAAGHVTGATHIDAQTLPQRLHELPPRGANLALFGDSDALGATKKFLESKDYGVVCLFTSDASTIASFSAVHQWCQGEESIALWTPCRYLAQWMDDIEAALGDRAKPTAIDVGCGGGRDAVFLARRGWDVLGIDYDERATRKASQLGEQYQGEIRTQVMNLETQADPFGQLTADLVVVCRYLHRPLFPALQRIVKPGGFIFYHTFMVGAEAFGKPRSPHHLLKPDELADLFSGWEILRDEVHTLQDGRPVAAFLAQKPAAE